MGGGKKTRKKKNVPEGNAEMLRQGERWTRFVCGNKFFSGSQALLEMVELARSAVPKQLALSRLLEAGRGEGSGLENSGVLREYKSVT